MKILFIADPNLIHDVRWIDAIRSKGHACYILPRRRHYMQFKNNKKILPQGLRVLNPIHDPSSIRPFRDFLQALRIRQIVRRNHIELIHIMYAEPNALWGNWKSIFKIPMILTTLGTDILVTIPSFFKKTDWLNKLISWQYQRALSRFNAITCTSGLQCKKLLELKVKIPIHTIRTGVDFSLINNSKDDVVLRIGLNKPFILMPRNMRPIYNHEFTLDAISLLDKGLLDEYCFVFVDANAENQAYFKTIFQKAKSIEADIRFFNSFSHNEIISLYKQAALVVMNPVSDGSPVSAMEAIACKTPVILPPLAYDNEIFAACFFFQTWTPGSLKNMIEEVLTLDHQVLKERLTKGSDCIQSLGDIQLEINKIERIYQSLLDGIQR